MKRIVIATSVIILIFALLFISSSSAMLIYANKNIDYDFDESLFEKSKEDKTVYYYAKSSSGDLKEVYKSSHGKKTEWTRFDDIADALKNGFISMEDREFYEHTGVNIRRTLAAAVNHIFKVSDSFGASTITQQLVKNISGDNETTVSRKVKEILRSVNIEKNHSKNEIFELYLNIVPMSANIYGVGAASKIFFGKSPSDISIEEAATIVGITNAPSRFNPYTNPDACIEKRNRVLYAMKDSGYISKEDYEVAVKKPLVLCNGTGNFGISSWFIETANEEVLSDIAEKYGVSHSASRLMLNGCRIILTMNSDIQIILEDYFSNKDNLSEKISNGLNYAMVVSDPFSGDLLGIIGNGGEKRGELLFNYAISPITPGSVLKPIAVYAPLIDKNRISWSTIIDDSPIEYREYGDTQIPYPKNSPDIYEGDVDVNYALLKSKNTIAAKLFNELGADFVFRSLKESFGFDTLIESRTLKTGETLSDKSIAPLALGQLSVGVSIRKLTEAYNVFPSEGIWHTGRSYIAVYNSEGKCIVNREVIKKRVYEQSTAQIMNQLLSNVVLSGTARQITLKDYIDVAGKTGTSGNDRDRLFVGYTPYFTAGIWCGYGSLNKSVGNNTPNHLQIWDEVMRHIHEKTVMSGYDDAVDSFNTNKLIVMPYCSKTGKTPTEKCELSDDSEIRFGYFKPEEVSDEICDYHR